MLLLLIVFLFPRAVRLSPPLRSTTDVYLLLKSVRQNLLGSRDVATVCQWPLRQLGAHATLTPLLFFGKRDRLLWSGKSHTPVGRRQHQIFLKIMFNLVSYSLHQIRKVKKPKLSLVENLDRRF